MDGIGLIVESAVTWQTSRPLGDHARLPFCPQGICEVPIERVQPIEAPVCLRTPTTTALGCRTLEPWRGLYSS